MAVKFHAIGNFLHVWTQQWGLFDYKAKPKVGPTCLPSAFTGPYDLETLQKSVAQIYLFSTCTSFLHLLQTKAFYSYWSEPVIIKNLKRGLASLFQFQLKTGKVIEVKSATTLDFLCLTIDFRSKVWNKCFLCGYRMTCLEGARWSTGQSKVKWPERSSLTRARLKRKDSPHTAR